MKQAIVLLALTIVAAAAAPAQGIVAEDQAGSICVAPVKDDGDPRSYYSEHFAVRVDKGHWLSVPSEAPALIPGVALKDKHLVSIRDGSKTIESFWFRFDEFESRVLCLWYKPWYRTWSLWAAANGGQKCRCSVADDDRAD